MRDAREHGSGRLFWGNLPHHLAVSNIRLASAVRDDEENLIILRTHRHTKGWQEKCHLMEQSSVCTEKFRGEASVGREDDSYTVITDLNTTKLGFVRGDIEGDEFGLETLRLNCAINDANGHPDRTELQGGTAELGPDEGAN